MIGVIDYQAGNTRSVLNALKQVGIESLLTSKPQDLERCDGVILPGVGSAGTAMKSLNETGLSDWIRNSEKPFLGICLGMQLLFESSQESEGSTLGVLKGQVKSLVLARVPHMGWNNVSYLKPSPLQKDILDESFMYYAHSYASEINEFTIASTDGFCAAVQKDNFFGVQFHPEKSGPLGLRLLQNFAAICGLATGKEVLCK